MYIIVQVSQRRWVVAEPEGCATHKFRVATRPLQFYTALKVRDALEKGETEGAEAVPQWVWGELLPEAHFQAWDDNPGLR